MIFHYFEIYLKIKFEFNYISPHDIEYAQNIIILSNY